MFNDLLKELLVPSTKGTANESHSPKTCMDCKNPPTKEVKWAEGKGHAWFCDSCFTTWRAKHKRDINSLKDIKDGAASKKFSDNTNPNQIKEITELGSGGDSLELQQRSLLEAVREGSSMALLEDDLFGPPSEDDLAQRRSHKRSEAFQKALEGCVVKENEDGSIDVQGKFWFGHKNLGTVKYLPKYIKTVYGSYDISRDGLFTLEGTPQAIYPPVAGDKTFYGYDSRVFDCSHNHLVNLEGGPQIVDAGYDCSENPLLISLRGAPKTIGGSFVCSGTQIMSFEGGPQTVGASFIAKNCSTLVSLNGLPRVIKADLNLAGCNNLNDYSGLENCTIGGEVIMPRNFDLRKTNWRKFRFRKGIKIVESNGQIIEKFESDILRFLRSGQGLSGRHGMDHLGLKLDQITDEDVTVIEQPETAFKDILKGKYDKYMLFWVITTMDPGKEAKLYADREYGRRRHYSSNFDRIRLPHILAVSNGQKKFQDSSSFKHTSLKATASITDLIIAIPEDKFSAQELKQQRTVAQSGALAFRNPEYIAKENRARYAELLRNKYASMDFKQLVKQVSDELYRIILGYQMEELDIEEYRVYNSRSYDNWNTKKYELVVRMQQHLWQTVSSYTHTSKRLEQRKAESASDEDVAYYTKQLSDIKSELYGVHNFLKEKKLDASFT